MAIGGQVALKRLGAIISPTKCNCAGWSAPRILSGVSLQGGGSISGLFLFDADTNLHSAMQSTIGADDIYGRRIVSRRSQHTLIHGEPEISPTTFASSNSKPRLLEGPCSA